MENRTHYNDFTPNQIREMQNELTQRISQVIEEYMGEKNIALCDPAICRYDNAEAKFLLPDKQFIRTYFYAYFDIKQ